ncbi:MAG: DUF3106 domain-containing protein [Sulfuriferula sp.]|nr:DUF3106 domain-containing protein [Sulfuriferula sp.]
MGQQFIRLLILLACLLGVAEPLWAAGKTGVPQWKGLTPAQQTILAPVASKWSSMSELQRSRLLAVAAKYPQLKPEEQQRFQKRLTTWSSLTKEQRELARQNYKKLKQLPPKKQQVVKQKWLEKQKQTENVSLPVEPAKPAVVDESPYSQ